MHWCNGSSRIKLPVKNASDNGSYPKEARGEIRGEKCQRPKKLVRIIIIGN
jgi:hypothetical protein